MLSLQTSSIRSSGGICDQYQASNSSSVISGFSPGRTIRVIHFAPGRIKRFATMLNLPPSHCAGARASHLSRQPQRLETQPLAMMAKALQKQPAAVSTP